MIYLVKKLRKFFTLHHPPIAGARVSRVPFCTGSTRDTRALAGAVVDDLLKGN